MPLVADKPFSEQFNWKRIHAPRAWRPKPGDELAGFFGGRTLRNGRWGQYEVVILHVPFEGSYTISGTLIITLLDAAQVPEGHPIKITYVGRVDVENTQKWYKKFTLDVAVGAGLARDDMPSVEVPQ